TTHQKQRQPHAPKPHCHMHLANFRNSMEPICIHRCLVFNTKEQSMTRFLVFVLLAAMTALGTQISSPPVPSDEAPSVTFNKDVLPILQNNCQTCHRSGGVAPMSFQSYESTRPWAKAIKTATLN